MSSISFSNALGIHEKALLLRAERSEVLANNLANTDTPGYKARDFDFNSVLSGEMKSRENLAMDSTDNRHFQLNSDSGYDLQYRWPVQPSIDGNTVDSNTEKSEFTQNAMAYSSSFEFLNRKFTGLSGAIKGE